ncbi:hypothetical protein FIU86_00840 [Roseovarius sp. THAF9]|uniref:hypothetical protein n=1 Tax=Roseovarius sp. THAF9 TaxID=2587847 RepID=UPI0012679D88|nr:hypothetical protein [Roseovarius sp. THAF9]QFT91372.1 hypothetical protein FIU86_00840 [Roseovarius sp. THAF9]
MTTKRPSRSGATCGISLMLLWAFLSVFTAFSSFAPGTMPQFQPGGITVVLCTGDAQRSITVDETGTPVEAKDVPCPWVTHAKAADPVIAPIVAARTIRATHRDAVRILAAAPLPRPGFPPAQPRAPPAYL